MGILRIAADAGELNHHGRRASANQPAKWQSQPSANVALSKPAVPEFADGEINMFIATPATTSQRSAIASAELIHIAPRGALDQIVTDGPPVSNRDCVVHLAAGQGWSLFPFKLFRDYSVLDTSVGDTDYWGRYLYFFLGEPNWWSYRKNISPWVSPISGWSKLSKDHAVIRVPGKSVLEQVGRHVFHRLDDGVVVVRGEYRGPAIVNF